MADIMLGQLLHRPTIDPISTSSPLPVQLFTQVELETVVNAQTIAAGTYITATWDYRGESETMVVVSIDKQPWTLKVTNFPVSAATGASTATYPNLYSPQTTTHSASYPATAIITRVTCANLTEAALLPAVGAGGGCRIANDSAAVATCTLKILRIWR